MAEFHEGIVSPSTGKWATTLPTGSIAKIVQYYPDPDLRAYDDSGWTMGYAFNAEVEEIEDPSVLEAETTPYHVARFEGEVRGDGSAGLAVAHLGSTNMVTFRYRLRELDMRITEESFTAEDQEFRIAACSYDAIHWRGKEANKKAEVNPGLCKGDGLCCAFCPTDAIVLSHFTNEEVFNQIDAALSESWSS